MSTRSLAALPIALALVASPAAASGQERPAPQNPHVRLGGKPCTACHTTAGWRDVQFNHRGTRFVLVGQHQAVPCTGCHDLRDFRGAPLACGSCHADPHRGDAGTDCERCHVQTGWQQVAAQNAHARTRLPDLGVHSALRCEDCHRQTGAQPFTSRVAPCVTCHQARYDATTNPSHRTMGFATQCERCHQFTTWDFALYAQHDAVFGIYAGPHAGTWRTCATCHADPADYHVFSCTTCHAQGPTGQAHQGITGYQWESAACLTCHPGGRAGDLRQHDAVFPIFGGTHAGQWTTCADCHTDPVNRHVVSCLTGACHPQAATDQWHNAIPGYQYATAQCRSCHPDGRAGTFAQHDAIFPIYSGTHSGRWSSCVACHPDPTSRRMFTCQGSGCHTPANTDGNHREVANYRFDSQLCLQCHPQGRAGDARRAAAPRDMPRLARLVTGRGTALPRAAYEYLWRWEAGGAPARD